MIYLREFEVKRKHFQENLKCDKYVKTTMLTEIIFSKEPVCKAVGLSNSSIVPDSSFTASSNHGQALLAYFARLNNTKHNGWSPSLSDLSSGNSYLQIDLGRLHKLCAIETQGNRMGDHWTKTYKLQLSNNLSTWTYYQERSVDKVSKLNFIEVD